MLASTVTLSRVILAFLAFHDILHKKLLSAAVYIAAGALTDFLDGFIARKFGQKTRLGAHLDHLVDKFFVLLVLWAFVIEGEVSHWIFYPLALREVGIVLLRFYGFAAPVNNLGKIKTTVEFVALLTLCWEPFLGNLLLGTALLLAYLSAYEYVRKPLNLPALPFFSRSSSAYLS